VSDLPAFEMRRNGKEEVGRLCEKHLAARKELGWELVACANERWLSQRCRDCWFPAPATVLDSLIAADDAAARARETVDPVRVLPGQLGIFGGDE
jgi:hypothetical protein